jgi:hypothetical protein
VISYNLLRNDINSQKRTDLIEGFFHSKEGERERFGFALSRNLPYSHLREDATEEIKNGPKDADDGIKNGPKDADDGSNDAFNGTNHGINDVDEESNDSFNGTSGGIKDVVNGVNGFLSQIFNTFSNKIHDVRDRSSCSDRSCSA